MMALENQLPVPRVHAGRVAAWFGYTKRFPQIDLLVKIITHGVPVAVDGGGDLGAALQYGNHRSIIPYEGNILCKIADDVRLGRAFVFPRDAADRIPGLRVSPLGVTVSPSKIRIIHDLTFETSAPGVNADTDFSSAPPCKLGHVLRGIIWRILHLRRPSVTPTRILLSKMDVKDAFRQIPVEWAHCPLFGYAFRDLVVVDRRLQFGWRNSPGFWCLFSAALEHAHVHTTFRNAVVTPFGQAVTSHVTVSEPAEGECPVPLPPGYLVPPGDGGGAAKPFFTRMYVDDAVLVEPQCSPVGDRCVRASQSMGSDHGRLLGERQAGDPPLLAPEKVSSWHTRLEVLGWELDTVAMTISLPQGKFGQLRELLAGWPRERRSAPESELRSLMGKLLHVCEVVRPGKFFVRRMLNQLGMLPVQAWHERVRGPGGGDRASSSRSHVRLGGEFHDDLSFWRLMVAKAMGTGGGSTLSAPLLSFYLQPHSRTLISDASGDAMGGFCLETGLWWRINFDEDTQNRLRSHVQGRDDLSINVLELLAMVVTAWAFTVEARVAPQYVGESILMRGDNMSAVHWVNRCRGGREPRAGALMRILGCLEMRSGWCFRAKHVRGIANVLADGISRWDRPTIAPNLHALRPDIDWQEQHLGEAGADLCTDILASSTSVAQLRARLGVRTSLVADLGVRFAG